MTIPSTHQRVMPYLILDNAGMFHDFVQIVFDAETLHLEKQEDEDTIRHGEIKIGDSTIMFGNSKPEWIAQTANLFIYVDDADATYQKALDHSAISVMGLSDAEYGRTCGVKDPTGNVWWITSVK